MINILQQLTRYRQSFDVWVTLLKNCCKQTVMEALLLRRRVPWVGHMLRMDDERYAKQLLSSKLVVGKLRQGGQIPNSLVQYQRDLKLIYTASRGEMWLRLPLIKYLQRFI